MTALTPLTLPDRLDSARASAGPTADSSAWTSPRAVS